MDLTVRIPRGEKEHTIYAEGLLTDMTVTDEYAFVTLDDNYTVFIYYRLGTFRRIYVCAREDLYPGVRHYFPEADASMCTLAIMEGRSFDRFKRSMNFLARATSKKFYRYPPSFFWQLSELCRRGRNSRLNLALLVRNYDKSIRMGDIKWK